MFALSCKCVPTYSAMVFNKQHMVRNPPTVFDCSPHCIEDVDCDPYEAVYSDPLSSSIHPTIAQWERGGGTMGCHPMLT